MKLIFRMMPRLVRVKSKPPVAPRFGVSVYDDTTEEPKVWFPDPGPAPTRIEVRPEWQGRRWL